MPDTLASYSGWIRRSPRGRWRLWCRAATEQACQEELRKSAPRGADKLVRQGSANPNEDCP
jgi:hypothetical protein